MPKPVRAVQILMFLVAAITLLTTLAFLISVGVTAAALGAAAWLVLPGVVGLVLALRVPTGGKALRRGIIVLEAFYILLALAAIGRSDPRGVANLVLPVVILVLLFRPPAKRHFAGRAPVAPDSYF
ncbi:hypothetical protein [Actinomadura violacea]|uniref:Integral membrane protein n=1 Tax=Actinomadura violacea TaxID=2819934 RepID=A0ABS3RRB5_9ACTN|nr:hypothetical protein [Actinomadura violacea]MBO2458858.1 hypothetical protein [Actinomadura violacea]